MSRLQMTSKLISYLKKNQIKSRHYFFRNGVYSLRIKEDIDNQNIQRLGMHRNTNPCFRRCLKNTIYLMNLCFVSIGLKVGYATIKDGTMTLRVYERDLIHMIDIGVAVDLLVEAIKKDS